MNRTLIAMMTIAMLVLLAGGVVWAADSQAPAQLPATQARTVIEDQASAAGIPGRLSDNIARGTVTAVEEDQALITTDDGVTVTLLITGTTVRWLPGQPPTHTIELAVGDPVLAFGRPATRDDGGKALTALIIVVAEDEDLPKYLIRGKVVVATQQTIVVDTGQRERAITILPRTRFLPSGNPDLGDTVIALGQPNELGQWVGGAVIVPGAAKEAARRLVGKVTAIDLDAATLTVQVGRRGEVTIVTDNDTKYRIRDIQEPALADIKVGDRIWAAGRFEQDSQARFLARLIGVVAAKE